MKTFYELLCLLWFKNNQNNFVVYQPNGSSSTKKTPCPYKKARRFCYPL